MVWWKIITTPTTGCGVVWWGVLPHHTHHSHLTARTTSWCYLDEADEREALSIMSKGDLGDPEFRRERARRAAEARHTDPVRIDAAITTLERLRSVMSDDQVGRLREVLGRVVGGRARRER